MSMTRSIARTTVATAASLMALAAMASEPPVTDPATLATLDKVLAGDHRSDANRARDKYRHPKETLLFFGLEPGMTVVEISPSRGWYTEILGPVMNGRGGFYAAVPAITEKSPDFAKQNDAYFRAMLADNPALYGKARIFVMTPPPAIQVAPAGSADMVLTFRNVHNWAKAGNADAMFKAFYDALKPGGILGVVDHRAKPGTPFKQQIDSGYMTEEYVISTAEKAGFKFAAKSEANANPKDTKDYPGGVWTLPPTLREGEKDRDKYLAIGESDRMTLKFVKE